MTQLTDVAVDAPPPPRIRLARPLMGEEEVDAVRQVLQSGQLTNGPAVAEFERAFAELHEVDHAIAMANGTVALAAMLLAEGIGPGDEVIVPSFTFISTATSVLHVGATPVFADVDAETFNVDVDDVARRVTGQTKAIIAVDYAGQAAELAELEALACDAGALLLEDAAEAHGARYRDRPVGTWGRSAMFSFTPTKNMTTGEGAMVTTRDGDLAARLRLLRNHGQTDTYRHESLGYNWRLSDVQAAIGRVQLDRLPSILERKAANDARIRPALAAIDGVTPPVVRPDRTHTFMIYSLLLERGRDQVLAQLRSEGIEARLYFPPAHRQPVFGGGGVDLPVTDHLADHLLSIPFHAQLTDDELDEIVDALGRAVTAASGA